LQSQPADLPVITFVRTITPQQPGQPAVVHGSVLCLDKRTGACAYSNDNWPENLQSMQAMVQVAGDPRKQTVTLEWGKEALALNFTDKPVTDKEPYQAGKNDKSDSHAEGDQPANAGGSPTGDARQSAAKPAPIGPGRDAASPKSKSVVPATGKPSENKADDSKTDVKKADASKDSADKDQGDQAGSGKHDDGKSDTKSDDDKKSDEAKNRNDSKK
jgi:hypothetical protein